MSRIFLLVTCMCFAGLSTSIDAQQVTDRVMTSNINYKLSSDQIVASSSEALDGSPDAAMSLVNYYMFVTRDSSKKLYWAVIGAENGSATAQFFAFQFLQASTEIGEQRRALFWLRRSASQGDLNAIAVLKECNSLGAKRGPRQAACFGPGSD